MKLLLVFGTRPEVIKLVPVVFEAQRRNAEIDLVICSTGQHREMLAQALASFGIRPDVDLAVMQENQTLPALTARLLTALDAVMRQHEPDVVLVQGDTTSAFVAALAAFYLNIPVGHVEAGLRTRDLASPFPEELNRVMVARMARWHFAPTPAAVANLSAEGIEPDQIYLTGNTVVDAILYVRQCWKQDGAGVSAKTTDAIFHGRELVLVTAHRRENQGPALRRICAALRVLCLQHPDLGFVFPVHPSPQVRTVIHEEFATGMENLLLSDPVDFETNLHLQSRARLVITDSGGIQEEAPTFAVPMVVIREHTERMEGVIAGFATLAGTETDAIVEAANAWLADPHIKQRLAVLANPYGDGKAADRIIHTLLGEPYGALNP